MDKILRYYRNLTKNEHKQLRSEIKPLGYALWWVLRIGMIIGLIRIYQKETFINF